MFNHLATLLANLKTTAPMVSSPFAVPIDPSHVPAVLPQTLLDVRRILFGTDPDQDMLMHRIRQFIPAIMASHLHNSLTEFDPRLTDCELTPSFFFYARNISASAVPQSARLDLGILGTALPCDTTGRMRQSFLVSVSGGLADVSGNLGYNATFPAASPVPLAQTGVSLHITNPSQIATFAVDFLAPAVRSFGQMVADLESGGDAISVGLFGVGEDDPLASYRRAFESKSTIEQIAGIVLALGHQTEKQRFLRG